MDVKFAAYSLSLYSKDLRGNFKQPDETPAFAISLKAILFLV